MQVTADLFDPPIARKRDPATSKAAAVVYSETRLSNDEKLMLYTIAQYPGRTAGEYSRILKNAGMDWYKAARMTTKRISGLIAKEQISAGHSRKCEKTNNRAQTYYVRSDHL